MFVNQQCCQCDCLINVRIDGRFTPICSKKVRPENRVFVSTEHSLMLSTVTVRQMPPNDMMPEWASRHLNQAQVYTIPSINVIYFSKFPCRSHRFLRLKTAVDADGQTGLSVQIQPFEVCAYPAGTH